MVSVKIGEMVISADSVPELQLLMFFLTEEGKRLNNPPKRRRKTTKKDIANMIDPKKGGDK